jgi:hypothetical protein
VEDTLDELKDANFFTHLYLAYGFGTFECVKTMSTRLPFIHMRVYWSGL